MRLPEPLGRSSGSWIDRQLANREIDGTPILKAFRQAVLTSAAAPPAPDAAGLARALLQNTEPQKET